MAAVEIENLRKFFGDQVKENVILSPYTSARIGGPADLMITVRTCSELQTAVQTCWDTNLPFLLLGSGSNVLFSDNGFRGIIILNKAKETEFSGNSAPQVFAGSGVVLSNLAHRCAALGYAGLEWAATVPGTVGGAVYGNAGAFGSDIAHNLKRAKILTPSGIEWWTVDQLEFGYRSSILKCATMKLHNSTTQTGVLSGNGGTIRCTDQNRCATRKAVILSAEFNLTTGSKEQIQEKIDEFTLKRKTSQPAGASMGSMFKNPTGDFAGRLIESVGLKGTRIGNAEISSIHANFMINRGQTRAEDVRSLIVLAQKSVQEKFGINLELEIEMIGEWQ